MSHFLIFKTAKEVADYTADRIVSVIRSLENQKPYIVLGLPTGSTPLLTYARLIELYRLGKISFKNVITVNMDEYRGLDENHPQSYRYFMNKNFFNHIDILHQNTHFLNGMAQDSDMECSKYDTLIKQLGGIDLQIGGIGCNGHLAFNEPGTSFETRSHLQHLSEETIKANSRFFDQEKEVPKEALTIGLKTIFEARQIIILATGKSKSQAIYEALLGPYDISCPASLLQKHANALFICDSEAASLLPQDQLKNGFSLKPSSY